MPGVSDVPPYQVTIYYREPTFEERIGRTGAPYRFTFDVSALTERGAVRKARDRFDQMARLSSVGWVREIVRIEARRADAD